MIDNQSHIETNNNLMQVGKQIRYNGIIYSINEIEKTAKIIGNYSIMGDIFIPRSIYYLKHEFIIISIEESSFKYTKNIRKFEISSDSEIRTIGKEAFLCSSIERIFIPRHVAKICEGAFKICLKLKIIEIAENSELETIEKEVFQNSSIESIAIPSNVKYLKDGWCCDLWRSTKLTIIENEIKNIKYFENEFIVGKSNQESDEFDTLLFVPRDTKQFKIPSFIKHIGSESFSKTLIENIIIPKNVTHIHSNAFKYCFELKYVEFAKDSELQIIDFFGFYNSSINEIIIPSHVVTIGIGCFASCSKLKNIEFSEDSEIQTIENCAFQDSSVESITIPSSIKELKKGWCIGTPKLNQVKIIEKEIKNICLYENRFVIGKLNQESSEFDLLLFAPRDTKQFIIPSFIKEIDCYAFSNCEIEEIIIPAHITKICEGTFSLCQKLKQVEIEKNSNLQTIESLAFFKSSIEKLTIPSSIRELKDGWCGVTPQLNRIEIFDNKEKNISLYEGKIVVGKSDPTSKIYDIIYFVPRNIKHLEIPRFITKIGHDSFTESQIEKVTIPSNVTHILSCAFAECHKLKCVHFEDNSELQMIDKFAFYYTPIERIFVPSRVRKIGRFAFHECRGLQRVEFGNESELRVIDQEAFNVSHIKCIAVPPNVESVSRDAFIYNHYLQIVEIDENAHLPAMPIKELIELKESFVMIPAKLKENLL